MKVTLKSIQSDTGVPVWSTKGQAFFSVGELTKLMITLLIYWGMSPHLHRPDVQQASTLVLRSLRGCFYTLAICEVTNLFAFHNIYIDSFKTWMV